MSELAYWAVGALSHLFKVNPTSELAYWTVGVLSHLFKVNSTSELAYWAVGVLSHLFKVNPTSELAYWAVGVTLNRRIRRYWRFKPNSNWYEKPWQILITSVILKTNKILYKALIDPLN